MAYLLCHSGTAAAGLNVCYGWIADIRAVAVGLV
jgi:hypothetical protein